MLVAEPLPHGLPPHSGPVFAPGFREHAQCEKPISSAGIAEEPPVLGSSVYGRRRQKAALARLACDVPRRFFGMSPSRAFPGWPKTLFTVRRLHRRARPASPKLNLFRFRRRVLCRTGSAAGAGPTRPSEPGGRRLPSTRLRRAPRVWPPHDSPPSLRCGDGSETEFDAPTSPERIQVQHAPVGRRRLCPGSSRRSARKRPAVRSSASGLCLLFSTSPVARRLTRAAPVCPTGRYRTAAG